MRIIPGRLPFITICKIATGLARARANQELGTHGCAVRRQLRMSFIHVADRLADQGRILPHAQAWVDRPEGPMGQAPAGPASTA